MEWSEDLYVALGQLVRAARIRAKLTQESLADRVGLTRASINNIEHGRQKILVHTLYNLAAALGLSPAGLLPRLVPRMSLEENDVLPHLGPDERQWVRAVLAADREE